MWAWIVCAVPFSVLAVWVSWSYRIFQTQCFTRRHPATHVGTVLLQASPATLKEAADILERKHARNEPVIFRNGSAMLGWPQGGSCWTPACLKEQLGAVSIEGARGATLAQYLEVFFGASSVAQVPGASCLAGKWPPCSIQAGAPFCTRPCLTNATINFALAADSDAPFDDIFKALTNQ